MGERRRNVVIVALLLSVCGVSWGQKKASNPNPADGAADVVMPLLRWTAGSTALFHNVYLGKTRELKAEHLVGARVVTPMFYYAAGLEPGVTYYWRADEIEADNVTIHTGDVWSFTVQALTAYRPDPADGATIVPPAPVLKWLAGQGAIQHRVYFSSNRDAVAQAAAGADKGLLPLATATFTPGNLDGATTYYWRVDEIVSGGVRAGAVWSFSTWMTVDDFESYTDVEGKRIYETWIDGWTNNTGSMVGYEQAPFAEQKIIHGGKQAMPLDYNNTKAPFYSEAERTFSPAQDWTAGGTDSLVLYVQGRGVDFEIPHVSTPPVIDGQMEAIWSKASVQPILTTIAGTPPTGPADASGQFRVLYDETNLYVLVDVNDDQFRNDSSATYLDDSVEFYVDADNTKKGPGLTGNARQYTFGWTDPVIAGTNTNTTGVQHAQVNTPTGWRIEIKFPWQSLMGTGAPVGKLIGIDCFYNDDDDGADTRETQIAWHSLVGNDWQTPASWGTALVVPPGATSPADYLYVALQDATNRSAVVTHPDPGILKATKWVEWKIPLSSFSGVNPARIKKMSLGVGDKAKPVTGRTGRVFIDDICLVKP
ncbi:MAG: hypothetical protein FJ280_11055 [Planctomycetes bacterium]|nr:hypothetical protein [Planctomycetota bacterium]